MGARRSTGSLRGLDDEKSEANHEEVMVHRIRVLPSSHRSSVQREGTTTELDGSKRISLQFWWRSGVVEDGKQSAAVSRRSWYVSVEVLSWANQGTRRGCAVRSIPNRCRVCEVFNLNGDKPVVVHSLRQVFCLGGSSSMGECSGIVRSHYMPAEV